MWPQWPHENENMCFKAHRQFPKLITSRNAQPFHQIPDPSTFWIVVFWAAGHVQTKQSTFKTEKAHVGLMVSRLGVEFEG